MTFELPLAPPLVDNCVVNKALNATSHTSSSISLKDQLNMQFAGDVNGSSASVLLDTGAGGIFLSQQFVQQAGINIVPSSSYAAVTSANGLPVQIFGVAILTLKLQSHHSKIRCLIADLGSSWDLIFGEPWLKQHKA